MTRHIISNTLTITVFLFITGIYAIATASDHDLGEDKRELLSRALAALKNNDWSTASELSRHLPDPLPMAIEWRRLTNQEPLPAFSDLATFRETRPAWPSQQKLAQRTEKAALDAPAAAVHAHFEKFPPETAYGLWALARVLRDRQDQPGAAASARSAWQQGIEFTESEEKAFLSEFRSVLTPEDHRARLDSLAWNGLEVSARRTLPLVDEDYRKLITARLWVRFAKPGVDARVAAVPPSLVNDPGLLYERARFRRRAGNLAGAAEILLAPPSDQGRPALWWEERHLVFRIAMRNGNFDLAYRLAASHGLTSRPELADCEWHAGWFALRFLDRPADALAHFETMWANVDTPISRARAAYWAGRAAAAVGDKDLSRMWYEWGAAFGNTFYGQEAAGEIGGGLTFERQLPTAELASYRREELPRLALLLAQVNDTLILKDVADAMIMRAEGLNTTANAIAVAMDAGRFDSAIRGNIPLFQAGQLNVTASHPIPSFAGLLQPADPDVEPALALAVARQESRFDIGAVSEKGALGLMQLMPSTARQVAVKQRLPVEIGLLTRDPDYNARLGVCYLGDLLRRFNSVALAAAAYNAGPQRAQDWIRTYGDPRRLDHYAFIDWLEKIPFRETRNYVQRIIEGQRVYAFLLADQ